MIAVEGMDCKWLGTSDVLEKLQNLREQEIEIQVISCQENTPSVVGQAVNRISLQDHQNGNIFIIFNQSYGPV